MAKRGSIRAVVLYSRSGFFNLEERHARIYYEALSKGSGCNGVGRGMCPGENYASD